MVTLSSVFFWQPFPKEKMSELNSATRKCWTFCNSECPHGPFICLLHCRVLYIVVITSLFLVSSWWSIPQEVLLCWLIYCGVESFFYIFETGSWWCFSQDIILVCRPVYIVAAGSWLSSLGDHFVVDNLLWWYIVYIIVARSWFSLPQGIIVHNIVRRLWLCEGQL